MTIDRMALQGLIEKGSGADLLREMIAFVTSRMMDAEVESMTGAGHGERSAERITQRNGYRSRGNCSPPCYVELSTDFPARQVLMASSAVWPWRAPVASAEQMSA